MLSWGFPINWPAISILKFAIRYKLNWNIFQMAVQHFHRGESYPSIQYLQWWEPECCPVCSHDRAGLWISSLLGHQWAREAGTALCFLFTASRYHLCYHPLITKYLICRETWPCLQLQCWKQNTHSCYHLLSPWIQWRSTPAICPANHSFCISTFPGYSEQNRKHPSPSLQNRESSTWNRIQGCSLCKEWKGWEWEDYIKILDNEHCNRDWWKANTPRYQWWPCTCESYSNSLDIHGNNFCAGASDNHNWTHVESKVLGIKTSKGKIYLFWRTIK